MSGFHPRLFIAGSRLHVSPAAGYDRVNTGPRCIDTARKALISGRALANPAPEPVTATFMTQIPTPVPTPSPAIPAKSPLAAFIASFGYAFAGLWYVLRTQRNARVHAMVAAAAVTTGIVLRISAVEFAITFVAISGVFITEMLNTGLEACVDLASPQLHPLAKTAKDVAAGAVLASAMLAVVIGLCIFSPHLWRLLFT
jgi:diacylglycerol kinase